jgi:hypothetical protein
MRQESKHDAARILQCVISVLQCIKMCLYTCIMVMKIFDSLLIWTRSRSTFKFEGVTCLRLPTSNRRPEIRIKLITVTVTLSQCARGVKYLELQFPLRVHASFIKVDMFHQSWYVSSKLIYKTTFLTVKTLTRQRDAWLSCSLTRTFEDCSS